MRKSRFTTRMRTDRRSQYTYIEVTFNGRDGNICQGKLLIDTGSINCIISKKFIEEYLDACDINENEKIEICSLGADSVVSNGIDFAFNIGEKTFKDTFYTNDSFNFMFNNSEFIGLVGSQFLTENKLVINYASMKIHEFKKEKNYDIQKYSFFFPMDYGLDRYGLPVVGIVNDEQEFLMVLDTGANQNLITKHVIEEGAFENQITGKMMSVGGVTGNEFDTTIRQMKFSIFSLGGDENQPKLCNHEELMLVMDRSKYLLEVEDKSVNLEPVAGVISAVFLKKNKWILDFGNRVIYRK
ncbi:MAG: hypothetical protein UHT92_01200 [Prevotella sp.]|nr:hypothetical protein [Prevotella sp.]